MTNKRYNWYLIGTHFDWQIDEQDDAPMVRPEWVHLERLAFQLQRHLGLVLFGADVIVENSTGIYYVIDINNFPSRCLEIIY